MILEQCRLAATTRSDGCDAGELPIFENTAFSKSIHGRDERRINTENSSVYRRDLLVRKRDRRW